MGEDAWHLLADCPALENIRRSIFFDNESLKHPNPEKLIHFTNYTPINMYLKHPGEEETTETPVDFDEADDNVIDIRRRWNLGQTRPPP